LKNITTLVLGLGNPILGDDGVGWHVAQLVQQRLAELGIDDGVEVDFIAVGGLSLMERMVGYDHAILIDALSDQEHPLGSLLISDLEMLPKQALGRLHSAHDITLQHALELGRLTGAHIPDKITIVGIGAQAVYDFSDRLSPIIEQAVPEAAQCVINLIQKEL
jgi:hydrogenase maturation protease